MEVFKYFRASKKHSFVTSGIFFTFLLICSVMFCWWYELNYNNGRLLLSFLFVCGVLFWCLQIHGPCPNIRRKAFEDLLRDHDLNPNMNQSSLKQPVKVRTLTQNCQVIRVEVRVQLVILAHCRHRRVGRNRFPGQGKNILLVGRPSALHGVDACWCHQVEERHEVTFFWSSKRFLLWDFLGWGPKHKNNTYARPPKRRRCQKPLCQVDTPRGGLKLFEIRASVCVCVSNSVPKSDSQHDSTAGGWSVPQMSPANEDASVAQWYDKGTPLSRTCLSDQTSLLLHLGLRLFRSDRWFMLCFKNTCYRPSAFQLPRMPDLSRLHSHRSKLLSYKCVLAGRFP